MKKLTIPDAETMVMALQAEIRRSHEARYDHRLHGILLVAQGMTCLEVARLLGDSLRTVQYWVKRVQEKGLCGLEEGERPGRPRFLSEAQFQEVSVALRLTPEDYGLSGHLWDGKILSAFIQQHFQVNLGVRQCQRFFRKMGFRLRKPRPLIAHADPEVQRQYKKTGGTQPKS
jgi:transposase